MPQESYKSCLFCIHIDISMSTPGYSEYTPGSDFHMNCWKDHWEFRQHGLESDLARCLIHAEHCKDYEFNPRIIKDIERARD